MSARIKVTVVGSGYVGMSLAVLLSQKNEVVILDIDPDRIERINQKRSTIEDSEISKFLREEELNLSATLDPEEAFKNSNFIIIATPTNYDPESNYFDTKSVDAVCDHAHKINPEALIIVKSTIPVGHTEKLQKKYETNKIIFSPEFLREGRALIDNLYPSRIIIGSDLNEAKIFATLLEDAAEKEKIPILFMPSTEAEAVKLFANAFLAMRVAFFNEIDSYSLFHKLDTKSIIDGISGDERIGDGYNNPSFGYGGYCLPKDTKQLLANFENVPQSLIESIVSSNSIRKDFLSKSIIDLNPNVVGIYRLIMKDGSDNFRESAVQDIIKILKQQKIKIIIYEPECQDKYFLDCEIKKSLEVFKTKSDIIIANRLSQELLDVSEKIFSRDIYGEN